MRAFEDESVAETPSPFARRVATFASDHLDNTFAPASAHILALKEPRDAQRGAPLVSVCSLTQGRGRRVDALKSERGDKGQRDDEPGLDG